MARPSEGLSAREEGRVPRDAGIFVGSRDAVHDASSKRQLCSAVLAYLVMAQSKQ